MLGSNFLLCLVIFLVADGITTAAAQEEATTEKSESDYAGAALDTKMTITVSYDCEPAFKQIQPGQPPDSMGFPDPQNCAFYWWCWWENNKWSPVKYECEKDSNFDLYGQSCVKGPCPEKSQCPNAPNCKVATVLQG